MKLFGFIMGEIERRLATVVSESWLRPWMAGATEALVSRYLNEKMQLPYKAL